MYREFNEFNYTVLESVSSSALLNQTELPKIMSSNTSTYREFLAYVVGDTELLFELDEMP